MSADWQTISAGVIVAVTLLLFLRGILRKKGGGCSGCACGVKPAAPPPGKRNP